MCTGSIVFCRQEHFRTLGSPLKAVNTFPTLQSQEERYLRAGYGVVDARDMNSAYQQLLSDSERQRIENMELFDEFPEWHLKCAHYTLVLASKGDCSPLHKKVTQEVPLITCGVCQEGTFKLSPVAMENCDPSLSRYGHASVVLTGDTMLLIGGYGPEHGKHSRLGNCLLLHYNRAGRWVTSKLDIIDAAILPAMMHHTATKTSDGRVIIFGGRQSPKSASNVCYQLTNFMDNLDSSNVGAHQSHNKWKIEVVKAKGQLPLPRYKHSAVNVQAMDGTELIIIFGGRTNTGVALDNCSVFSINSNTWEEVVFDGEMPTARFSHSCFTWKNSVYIIGGLGSDFIPLNSIYKLSIEVSTRVIECIDVSISFTQTDTRIVSKQLKLFDFPYQYASPAVCHGDVAYLIGGICCQGDGTTGVVTIHLSTMTWSQCGVPADHHVILANHTAHYWRDNNIVTLGGGGNCFSFGTHYNSVYSLQLT